MKKIRHSLYVLLSALLIGAFLLLYFKGFAPTEVGFVNYPDYLVAGFADSNSSRFIKVSRINWKEGESPSLKKYAAVYIFGMGLRLSPEQKATLDAAVKAGVAVHVTGASSKESDMSSISGKTLEMVDAYMSNGGKENYRRLLNYTRSEIDKKWFFRPSVEEPVKIPSDCLFHIGEGLFFETVAEYEVWYKKAGLYKENAPKLCFLTTNAGPSSAKREHLDDTISAFEKAGFNVYPLYGFRKRMQIMKELSPDMVVLMPHGRFSMGGEDDAVEYLKSRNIPLICPINVFEPYERWKNDQKGMGGGILSQSIVMPEIDGGIAPYVLSAQFKNEAGLYEFKALPDRLEKFSSFIAKLAALKKKANSDKKIVIVYYKGPGANALNASGLEVGDSLLNFLKYLKASGYDTGDIPEDSKGLLEMIQKQTAVFGTYARGAEENFIKSADPELISVEDYKKWALQAMPEKLYSELVESNGEPPGKHMALKKDGKSYLALGRIKFGNIVLMPQSLPGEGEDSSMLIHGVKEAPPHPYVATYLWARFGYNADAIIHFGTHGSLEFTPWKQVALSSYDWPDALIAGIPHFYIYTINNIGEAVIAKRRSYATMLTHLTPPFMESGISGELQAIHEKIDTLETLENESLRQAYEKSIAELAAKLNLHKDLSLAAPDESGALRKEDLMKLHNYIHEIDSAKVGRGLYVIGRKYSDDEASETAKLMAVSAIADSLANVDIQKGTFNEADRANAHIFESRYLDPARKAADAILAGAEPDSFLNPEDLAALKGSGSKRGMSSDKPVDIASAMMAMQAQNSGGRTKSGKKEDLSGEELNKLILKICAEKEQMNFLLSLKDSKSFERAASMDSPAKLEKARQLAKLIPPMAAAVEMLSKDDIRRLVAIMNGDEKKKDEIFRILEEPSSLKSIGEAADELEKSRAERCRNQEYKEAASFAVNQESGEALLSYKAPSIRTMRMYTEKLRKIKERLEYLSAQAANADRIASMRDLDGGKDLASYLKKNDGAFKIFTSRLDRVIAGNTDIYNEYIRSIKLASDALNDIVKYKNALLKSTDSELEAAVNALNGGYIEAGPGGDPIISPDSIPTGRNLYALDAERTPTKEAWQTAIKLNQAVIDAKMKKDGVYPKKVAFSFWGGEFIRGKGVEIAQALHFLGIEPVWDSRGMVKDVKLIPMEKLQRPRIDVVVQTSGQFRGIGASRLQLIDKAVRLAAAADDGDKTNSVKEGVEAAEKFLISKGLSPMQARNYSAVRVFGGVNGNYGTGITGMVEAGDKWEKDSQIAKRYMQNMGAIYTQDRWCEFKEGVFEAALLNTDTVMHQRSSNTSGPISLDHVYEFMGGMNLAVRNVTGKDPDAIFSDLRSRTNPRVQGAKEAAMVEARSTILNPKYIGEMMQEGPSAAETFAETFRNCYGWEVMKPDMLEDYLWEDMKSVYIDDKLNLGVRKFFDEKNPYALQEMSAVMLETIRKGYWKASPETTAQIAAVHMELVEKHKPGCSGFVCNNQKLRDMIASLAKDKSQAENYKKAIEDIRNPSGAGRKDDKGDGMNN